MQLQRREQADHLDLLQANLFLHISEEQLVGQHLRHLEIGERKNEVIPGGLETLAPHQEMLTLDGKRFMALHL